MLNLFSLGVPCCILFLLAACSLMFAASHTQPFLVKPPRIAHELGKTSARNSYVSGAV